MIWLGLFSVILAPPILCTDPPVLDGAYYFDRFGDVVHAVYTGGHMLFVCFVPQCIGDERFVVVDPQLNDLVVGECINGNFGGFGAMRVNITEQIVFGAYKCKYQGVTSVKSIIIGYRLCDHREALCMEDDTCNDPEKFCFVSTVNGKESCSRLPNRSLCIIHEINTSIKTSSMCPIHEPGLLCAALLDGYNFSRSWSYHDNPECYSPAEANPWLQYNNNRYSYTEPIRISADHKVIQALYKGNPKLDAASHIDVTCILKDDNETEIHKQITTPPKEVIDFILNNEIFTAGSRLYKIDCKYHTRLETRGPYIEEAGLTNTLVFMGGDLHINGHPADNSKVYTNVMECQMDPTPTNDFKVSYSWIQKSTNATVANDSKLNIAHDDEYQCHVKIIFKSCTPHRKFQFDAHTDFVKAAIQSTSTKQTSKVTTTGGSTKVATGTSGAKKTTKAATTDSTPQVTGGTASKGTTKITKPTPIATDDSTAATGTTKTSGVPTDNATKATAATRKNESAVIGEVTEGTGDVGNSWTAFSISAMIAGVFSAVVAYKL